MNEVPQPSAFPQPGQPQPRAFRPYATYIIFGVTIFFYLLQVASKLILGDDWLLLLGAKYGPLIQNGQIWRFVTPVLLHGSLLHIVIDMFNLFIIGKFIEPVFGHLRFTAMYFLSAFAGNVVSFLMSPDTVSLGAGSAIFSLVAAESAFLFLNRKVLGEQVWRTVRNIGIVLVLNLFISFLPGFDSWPLIGGLLGGMLFAWFGGPRLAAGEIITTPQGTLVKIHDERAKTGILYGTLAVLAVFIPLAALGWFWVR